MRFTKKIFTLLGLLLMLIVSVHAQETTDYFYEVSLDLKTGESTVTEKDIMSKKDFSNLLVSVTKTTPDGETTEIYTGPLSNYDNGRWINVDFSDNSPLLIVDWQAEISFWVTPIQNTEASAHTTQNVNDTSTTNSEDNIYASSDLEITSQIKLNGVTVDEKGLRIIDDSNMSCNLIVSNNSNTDREITALLVTYTHTGALYNVSTFNIDADALETANTEFIYRFDAEKEYTGKLIFWESILTLLPIRSTINFSQESGINAYYYNSDNRLLQIDKINGTSICFTYDNTGNLLTKTTRE